MQLQVFTHHQGELCAEGVKLADIAARYGTPTYVYSRAAITASYHAYTEALAGCDHRVCFAVKANSNLAVLNILARLGAGFDIVSVGELERVLAAGGKADGIVFSGVGKREDEIVRALQVGIHCFNVESRAELQRIQTVAARLDIVAPVSLRVNPDVDANTHPYISTGLRENKFGIDMIEALDVYRDAKKMSHINVKGIDCHIGSQLTELTPFLDALERVLGLVDTLAAENIHIEHLDIGGGLGVVYRPGDYAPTPGDYMKALRAHLGERKLKILVEPGRSIVANAGVLLTRVDLLKSTPSHHFAVVDAAMNDLIRPALYQAWQDIEVVKPHAGKAHVFDIVGPICETGDFLGKARELTLDAGDLLAIRGSGAYGFVMSSNYNSRTRAAEVMVDGDKVFTVRARETLEDLWRGESLLA
ncbi:MAG TPA: diaminopimelate decarboxylase, partial [Pseudomonadales bacterium]|nr:diaminopimelate decarboxylase [Pseudomonadales bacterium]